MGRGIWTVRCAGGTVSANASGHVERWQQLLPFVGEPVGVATDPPAS